MRILFSFAGGNGHFQPLIPVARAAQSAGHTVAIAGQAGMIPVIEASGFDAIPIGGNTLLDAPQRLPLLKLDPAREDRSLREGFATKIARQHASAILSLSGSWEPDVLVCDEVDFGTIISAEVLGIPYATVLVIASGSFIRKEVIAEPLSVIRADHGLPPDPELKMLSRYLVLSPFPPSFRHPSFSLPATAHSFRLHNLSVDRIAIPDWGFANGLPTVYFTLGTIFNLESGDLFERVFAGLRDLPINVIATVGGELNLAEFGRQPENIRIEQYIPQDLILPHCAIAISHGGSGSVIGALTHGVPMVLLPIGADQPHNASRCEELGIARVLDAVEAAPGTIRSAVSDVLTNPRYQKNVEPLRIEIAALPGPEYALGLLEKLVEDRER